MRFTALAFLAALVAVGVLFLRRQEEGPQPVAAEPEPVAPIAIDRAPLHSVQPAPGPAVDRGDEQRWRAHNNEATRVLAAGDLERAVQLLEECHAARPDNAVYRGNLAEALIRLARVRHDEEHDVPAAVEGLARAVELAPEREDVEVLRALLARWRDEIDIERDHWTEGSDLFELSYDTAREDILASAQQVLDHLEDSYERLRLWFQHDPVREGGRPKIRVHLYDREEFDRLTGLGHWAGGVFDGIVRVSVNDLTAERAVWERVLRHELVHAFLQELGGGAVPGWLNEGLAQWLEESEATRPLRLQGARTDVQGAALFPLERLRASLAGWNDTEAIERAYAQSLLLVDHLITNYGEHEVRLLVDGCGMGKMPEDVFRESRGFGLALVLEDLRAALAR